MLRGPTGAPKSTPTMALGALLGVGPLQNSILAAAAKTYYHIKNTSGIKLVRKMGPRELTSRSIIDMPQERIPKTHIFDKKYKISISERDSWEKILLN